MALSDMFPVAARRGYRGEWAWTALLIVAAVLSSFTFECVTPFSAFAVLTAATMRMPRALGMMVAIWLVNQSLGFVALGYPFDGTTLAWGGVIGVAALAAVVAAAVTLRAAGAWLPWLSIAAGFAAAFIVYEVVLLSATSVLGGFQNFSVDIVAKLVLSDLCWLVGIAILRHGLLRAGAISGRLAVRT